MKCSVLFKLAPTQGKEVEQTILYVTDSPLPPLQWAPITTWGIKKSPSPLPTHISVVPTPSEARAEGPPTGLLSLGHRTTRCCLTLRRAGRGKGQALRGDWVSSILGAGFTQLHRLNDCVWGVWAARPEWKRWKTGPTGQTRAEKPSQRFDGSAGESGRQHAGRKRSNGLQGRVAPCGDKREKGFWRIRSLPEGFFYSLDGKQWTFLVSVLDLWG